MGVSTTKVATEVLRQSVALLLVGALAFALGLAQGTSSASRSCTAAGMVWGPAEPGGGDVCRLVGVEDGGVAAGERRVQLTSTSGPLGDWQAMGHARSRDSWWATAARRGGVWVYGDSITMQTRADLAKQFGLRQMPAAIDAWSGRPSAPAIDQLEQDVARWGAPRTVVLAIGTNDIFDPSAMRAQAARALAVLPSTTRVVWVDISAQRPKWAQADRANAATVNSAIRAAAAERGGVTIVGWREFLDARPGRVAMYLKDGVHPSATGVPARSALLMRALGLRVRS